jgi:cyclopropane fatty-acyl-phospholipid synthase-like methyltransferase
MSRVQARANEMMDAHGFLGVPRETFEEAGRAQLVRLLQHGLQPESKVLDIGCGCLRAAYWLIRFLDPECYCGIEPARERVELGRRYLFSTGEMESRRPRFDFNSAFDLSVFSTRFDFVLAYSIWTHCGKPHIETILDGFLYNSAPDGVFLASYLPAATAEEDYMGDSWVGTSHESDQPGVIRHALEWIRVACARRGIGLTTLPGIDCDGQYWLRIERS